MIEGEIRNWVMPLTVNVGQKLGWGHDAWATNAFDRSRLQWLKRTKPRLQKFTFVPVSRAFLSDSTWETPAHQRGLSPRYTSTS